MRNKGFFWSITVALVLACIYQLSFTWATSGVEKDAEDYAKVQIDSLYGTDSEAYYDGKDTFYLASSIDSSSIENIFRGEYLKSKANEEIHFGYSYAECKEKEINLGLDLKGGMSATLEISVPELVSALAGNTLRQEFRNPFNTALERTNLGEGDFIDLFVEEYDTQNNGSPMAKVFHMHNPDELASDATNEEVAEFLKEQANKALDGIEIIIEKRVNQFGVAQPTIQKQPGSNRIFVELPGITDKESVRRKLQSTANLEFYEVYDNAANGISGILAQSQTELSRVLFGDVSEEEEEIVEEAEVDTTATENALENLLEEGEEAVEEAENALENLLDGEEEADTTGEDNDLLTEDVTDEADQPDSTLSSKELEEKYPIQSLLNLAIQYDESGQPIGYAPGSTVGYARVRDTATLNVRLNHPVVRNNLPQDLKFMWSSKELTDDDRLPMGLIYLHAIKVPRTGPQVSGKDIKYADLDNSQIGKFGVRMVMNDIGADKWNAMTKANLKRQVAITMDNIVYSAPVVQEEMKFTSSITGDFSMAEAKDLSGLLNAGALPAPVRIVDESIVGASLGADNINSGLWSFAFALLIVLVYMVFYYNRAGLVADAALLINIFLLIGALASLKAILTLPGIAGIVLTIGMSVDANVLIFERIREELRGGKGVKGAIKEGYAKALSAILDANITTLLTGIVLAVFGTGPIKGFATTLIIGIFTSFFAAVVITRLIITAFTERDKKVTFSSKLTENWFTKSAVPFVRKRKMFYLVSAAVVLLGIGSLVTRGLDFGVDFSGGRQYKVVFQEEADFDGIRTVLKDKFDQNEPGVKMVDNDFTALITTKHLMDENADAEKNTQLSNTVDSLLRVGLAELTTGDLVISDSTEVVETFEITESKMIAPTISKDLKTNSLYAIGFSLLIIFLYIVFRFRKWQYGLGALIAMAHDVLIVLSIFSIAYGWIGFSMEIDQAFIAAILTVVGYSINDTVVVFDRIREYLGLHPKKDRKEVINMALNSTLGRTVNTSVSTFIVLLVIFIFGGDAIKGFVFALMIGVVVGTYSSLFIATPAVIDFTSDKEDKKK